MYRLETGTYGKLVVKNQRKIFEIYINTQLGTLLVYGQVLKIFKYKIRFWKHLGPWIKDYRELVKVEKRVNQLKRKVLLIEKKQVKELNNNIKKSYVK